MWDVHVSVGCTGHKEISVLTAMSSVKKVRNIPLHGGDLGSSNTI